MPPTSSTINSVAARCLNPAPLLLHSLALFALAAVVVVEYFRLCL